jgi:hypothetical protein
MTYFARQQSTFNKVAREAGTVDGPARAAEIYFVSPGSQE